MKNAHPNGFIIRNLWTFANKARLRLHTWSNIKNHPNDPHNHRTWFISIPLWGVFLERRFKETIGNIPTYICRSNISQERLNINFNGFKGLKYLSSHVRFPLIPYFCSQDKIHTFEPINEGFAATLVLFGPPKQTPKAFISKITSQNIN